MVGQVTSRKSHGSDENTPLTDERKTQIAEWLRPQFIVTVLSLVTAIGLAWGNLKSDIRDHETRIVATEDGLKDVRLSVAAIERARFGDRELLIEIRGDVKNLTEKMESRP